MPLGYGQSSYYGGQGMGGMQRGINQIRQRAASPQWGGMQRQREPYRPSGPSGDLQRPPNYYQRQRDGQVSYIPQGAPQPYSGYGAYPQQQQGWGQQQPRGGGVGGFNLGGAQQYQQQFEQQQRQQDPTAWGQLSGFEGMGQSQALGMLDRMNAMRGQQELPMMNWGDLQLQQMMFQNPWMQQMPQQPYGTAPWMGGGV